MRIESSITAITWLPFAALDAIPDLPLGVAVAHYDEPPPEAIGDLDALREADAFREANELKAWIDVEDGRIVDFAHRGRGLSGRAVELGGEQVAFPAVEFPVLRPEPEVGDGCVLFVQSVGGRIGLPVPRPLRGKPYYHLGSALAWTTLQLVIHAGGDAEGKVVAASPFPRHSIYDGEGKLIAEHGTIDVGELYGDATPWGSEDVVVAAVEAQLEEELTRVALESGAKLPRRRLRSRESLVEQGDAGLDMFLLLDGVLDVEIDGTVVAQVGAGALLGELAVLGDGKRKATLRAARPCRVAVLGADQVRGSKLAELALARRHEAG